MTDLRVAGMVLAAGEGRRFGGPKAVHIFDGERLVDRAVRILSKGGCDPIVVVAGAVPLEVPGAIVVTNLGWREGIGSSLRAGLDSLPADVGAVTVTLVDQPWLSPSAVHRVHGAHLAGADVAVAIYGGTRGHPVLLSRGVWANVKALARGDVGARAFLASHPEVVTDVSCDDVGSPADVDYAADLKHGGDHTR